MGFALLWGKSGGRSGKFGCGGGWGNGLFLGVGGRGGGGQWGRIGGVEGGGFRRCCRCTF